MHLVGNATTPGEGGRTTEYETKDVLFMKALKIAAVAATLFGATAAHATYTNMADKVFHACVKVTHQLGNCSFSPDKIKWANNAPNGAISTQHAVLKLDGASPNTTFKTKVSNGTYGSRKLCKGHVFGGGGHANNTCASGHTINYTLLKPGTTTTWTAMTIHEFTTDNNGDAAVQIRGKLLEAAAGKPAGLYGDTIRLWVGY